MILLELDHLLYIYKLKLMRTSSLSVPYHGALDNYREPCNHADLISCAGALWLAWLSRNGLNLPQIFVVSSNNKHEFYLYTAQLSSYWSTLSICVRFTFLTIRFSTSETIIVEVKFYVAKSNVSSSKTWDMVIGHTKSWQSQ